MQNHRSKGQGLENIPRKTIVIIVVVIALLLVGRKTVKTVPAGHVGVVTLFGKVSTKVYSEGFHIANPLFNWILFDAREKSHMEEAYVPTQDQLQTKIDVSIQYRIIKEQAPNTLKETGLATDAINVHLVPKLRSVIREQGKSIKRAEDFFLDTTQEKLQRTLQIELASYLQPKGIQVTAVLIRDITLPPFIMKAIEAKKEREQAVEKQKAELERFRTEQQQKIAEAVARRKAAEEEAAQLMVLADAKAYEIRKVNEAVGQNTNYLKLQGIEALKQMSKDPATKIYFLNGDSPSPLPLMHLGDKN